jgi:hypothetical protein
MKINESFDEIRNVGMLHLPEKHEENARTIDLVREIFLDIGPSTTVSMII